MYQICGFQRDLLGISFCCSLGPGHPGDHGRWTLIRPLESSELEVLEELDKSFELPITERQYNNLRSYVDTGRWVPRDSLEKMREYEARQEETRK